MPHPMRLLPLTALVAALILGLIALPRSGAAQQPQATISGAITLATPGDTLPSNIEVQLIILEQSQDTTSVSTETDADSTFTFEVDPDPRFSYVPFVVYEGVQYFSEPSPVRFDGTAADVAVGFEVFSAVNEAPDFSIGTTTVFAVALERSGATITLIREDIIRRDEPTVYVGGEDGVTLRIPVPDGTIDAGGVDEGDTDFSFEGGVVNVSVPIRPGLGSIVTRYIVGYDAAEDMYRLRVTAPLHTEHLEARVPESFINKFEPRGDDTQRAPDTEFEGETILAIERIGAATPGQSLVVDFVGLSGAAPDHVLTTTRGAIIGSLLALIVIGGLVAGIARQQPTTVSTKDSEPTA